MSKLFLLTVASAATVALGAVAHAQELPAEYQAVLSALGKKGDFKDGVLKINLPRTDLHVTVNKRPVPTALGFGGWVSLTKGQEMDVLMGDLVLTEDEVNPIMSAVLKSGLDVTALHNHFFWEAPRIFYMHIHGMGSPADLAERLRPIVELIDRSVKLKASDSTTDSTASAGANLDVGILAGIIGTTGEQNGSVYKITIGRPDIDLREHGARINARMGLNTWAAFTGTDADAVVAGDVAMLESEVTPVLKALRGHGLNVVSIHHHMTGSVPMVVFLHYYGTGAAADLAQGVRLALDVVGQETSRDKQPIGKVLFICPHGAAKSVLASAYFRRLAEQRGLKVTVDFGGTDPDPAIAPRVTQRLKEQSIAVPQLPPRRVTPAALDAADLVISLGCDLGDFSSRAAGKLRRWDDVPPPSDNFELADQAILKRVNALVEELVALRDTER